ncbi:MAG: signal peptidase I [Clostridiales bacterium]
MSNFLSTIKDFVVTLLIAVVIAVILKFFIIDSCKILSGSMMPTLEKDDRVLVFKLAYKISEPKRGDVIVFDPPAEIDEGVGFIKRVIGLPGDTVEIKNQAVYVNGKALSEDYLMEKSKDNFGPVTVPKGEYFVLGDNRNNSLDSHLWSYPFITLDDIESKAFFQYYPFSDIGLIKK